MPYFRDKKDTGSTKLVFRGFVSAWAGNGSTRYCCNDEQVLHLSCLLWGLSLSDLELGQEYNRNLTTLALQSPGTLSTAKKRW